MRFLLICCLSLPVLAADADELLGTYYTTDNESTVEIYKCGDHYCGKIVALEEPIYPADDDQGMAGKPKVDRENPDPALRTRPALGLVIMEGFSFNGKIWSGGTIYDPNNGKTYKCKITPIENGKIKVRGYIGVSLLGRTVIWTPTN